MTPDFVKGERPSKGGIAVRSETGTEKGRGCDWERTTGGVETGDTTKKDDARENQEDRDED
jgi:hypothetical protein